MKFTVADFVVDGVSPSKVHAGVMLMRAGGRFAGGVGK